MVDAWTIIQNQTRQEAEAYGRLASVLKLDVKNPIYWCLEICSQNNCLNKIEKICKKLQELLDELRQRKKKVEVLEKNSERLGIIKWNKRKKEKKVVSFILKFELATEKMKYPC